MREPIVEVGADEETVVLERERANILHIGVETPRSQEIELDIRHIERGNSFSLFFKEATDGRE